MSEVQMPKSDSRTCIMTRTYKKLGRVIGQDHEEELLEVQLPPEGVPVGEVSVRAGFTKGLDKYCSISFSSSVSFPCVKDEAEDAYNAAYEFVWRKNSEELKQIKERYDDGNKPL